MDYETATRNAIAATDFELHQQVNTKAPMSEDHIAAKLELERRERRRRFWRQDLVAWLALILAVISLLVTAANKAGKEIPRETLLEKECSAWADNTMRKMRDADRSRYALLLGACMNGGQPRRAD